MKENKERIIVEGPSKGRIEHEESLEADLVITGGGMAGTCCALAAARQGIRVILVQDRPVLGGNASSEVRLWIVSATQHQRNNNRWSREGGIINEILLENLWRNKEGNPVIFDSILLEKFLEEANITLLLNTAVFEVGKSSDNHNRISQLRAFNSQNSTFYILKAPLFCDSSGDGIVAFQSGAAFRMGAESKEEFNEPCAPEEDFGNLMGHSLFFYSKTLDRPVKYVPPAFALKDFPKHIPNYKKLGVSSHGCGLWWIEYGGRLDTIRDTEKIKWELWRIIYGAWDYIKNSGEVENTENMTLEWVGMIPGKRESRRFEGDYLLTQKDVIDRHYHDDDIAFGGWSIDLHPADAVYGDRYPTKHMRGKGIYSIPYRCYYSRNIENLFLAGRIISTSHVAFASTRIMGTCAYGGQAIGVAAATCVENSLLPKELYPSEHFAHFRRRIQRMGQHIPGVPLDDPDDLVQKARITASSEFRISQLKPNGPWETMDRPVAQLLPFGKGKVPKISLKTRAKGQQKLSVSLWKPGDDRCYSPDIKIGEVNLVARGGEQDMILDFQDLELAQSGYLFLLVEANDNIEIRQTETLVTGICNCWRLSDKAHDYREVGGDKFNIYAPGRRPSGQNFALGFIPELVPYSVDNIRNGWQRPTPQGANAWVANPSDPEPALTLKWDTPQQIRKIEIAFDVDYNHPLENVLWQHPENAVPFCVKHFVVTDGAGSILCEENDFHQALCLIDLKNPIETTELKIRILETWGSPAALMEVRVSS